MSGCGTSFAGLLQPLQYHLESSDLGRSCPYTVPWFEEKQQRPGLHLMARNRPKSAAGELHNGKHTRILLTVACSTPK